VKVFLYSLLTLFLFSACRENSKRLPLLGEPTIKVHDAETDTIYPVVPPFSFTDQDGRIVNNQTFKGKNYIADFFFTSCPSICPVMSRNLKKISDLYKDEPRLNYLSFTIDPKYDSIPVLKRYAEKLGADLTRWHFVTGQKEAIYQLAEKGFYSPANKDDSQAGGFVHSSGLILIDRNGHMRGVYDGTSDKEVGQLIDDLKLLLAEK
jgi:protein SCO1/2